MRQLAIPPAWTDVAIHPDAKGTLQAVGKDAAGRWQYRYHERHTAKQGAAKFKRVVAFAHALPKLRRRLQQDLRKPGLGREKVMACILRIMGSCFIRAGSQVYAEENGSYGIATLRPRHVKIRGDTLIFDFKGKSKKHVHRELTDRRVTRIVKELLQVPGRDIFKFVLDDGHVVDVRRRHINEYIHEVMGAQFSAKDLRTWAGTLICACALARAGTSNAPGGKVAAKRCVVAAVKEAAEYLGNTPSVAKASYIYPPVIAHFEKGRVVDRFFASVEEFAKHERASLHGAERALLELLGGPAV